MQKLTIDDRLESAANYGETEIFLFLWEKTIERLKKDGLTVDSIFSSKRKGEHYCKISWTDASKEGTQANHLYKMAQEAKK